MPIEIVPNLEGASSNDFHIRQELEIFRKKLEQSQSFGQLCLKDYSKLQEQKKFELAWQEKRLNKCIEENQILVNNDNQKLILINPANPYKGITNAYKFFRLNCSSLFKNKIETVEFIIFSSIVNRSFERSLYAYTNRLYYTYMRNVFLDFNKKIKKSSLFLYKIIQSQIIKDTGFIIKFSLKSILTYSSTRILKALLAFFNSRSNFFSENTSEPIVLSFHTLMLIIYESLGWTQESNGIITTTLPPVSELTLFFSRIIGFSLRFYVYNRACNNKLLLLLEKVILKVL